MCKHPMTKFFAVSSAINFIFLIVTAVILCCFGDHVYQLHSQWFHISREVFDALVYGLMGIYKLFFWVFNLVPLIALWMVSKCCNKASSCSSKDPNCCCKGQNGSCCKCPDCSCSCRAQAALNK